MIATQLEATLHFAFVNARQKRHEFITVEHLLLALLDDKDAKPALVACAAKIEDLRIALHTYIANHTPVVSGTAEVDTQPTVGFQRVIQRSILHTQAKNGKTVTGTIVLLAIYGERESYAFELLQEQGITRLDVVNYIAHGTQKTIDERSAEQTFDEFNDIVLPLGAKILKSRSRKTEHSQPKLFISYSHVETDKACLDRLLVHLKPLEQRNELICWSDKKIHTGDKWRAELEKNIDEAAVAILLVSADFIVKNELPPLLVKAESKGIRILPVILMPCGYTRDPILKNIQSVNDPAKPLLGLDIIDQEHVYDRIAAEVTAEIVLRAEQQLRGKNRKKITK